MYSSGTAFHKLIGEAMKRKQQINTAADIAERVKDALSSIPLHIVKMEVVGSEVKLVGNFRK